MPTRPKDRFRIFEAKPAVGGNLISRGSADNAGIFNYTRKLDWRRDLDVEIRREGIDYFCPNITLNDGINPPYSGQPFPSLVRIDSLTYSGGLVTATRLQGHHFQNGEQLIITGATDSHYNGTFTISGVTPTTFQYAPLGAPAISPDTSTTITAAALETINLIAMARRPNGQTAVIAGSARRLYRYYALTDSTYISHDPADYPVGTTLDQLAYWSDGFLFLGDQVPPQAPGFWGTPTPPVRQQEYVDEIDIGQWIVIGSGFSLQGNRWETVSINGYMVFNNGVDLPCTYRVEDLSVVPIYELREQGIASVGTIAEVDGILMIGDISEIHTSPVIGIYGNALQTWFRTAGQVQIDSLTFAMVAGVGTVTGTIAAGQPFTVGQTVIISGAVHPEYDGTFVITATTATTFKYTITGAPASPDPSSFIFGIPAYNTAPYGIYNQQQNIDRTTFRIGWGTPGEPRRWAAVVLGTINAFSNVITLEYPVLGFSVGQDITIVGAGTSHAGGTSDNLTGNILNISGATVIIDAFAQTSVVSAVIQASDSLGSIVGFEDLQDDGSGILKMIDIADQLVIFKDSSVFLGQYLGNVAQPFAFAPRRIQKEQSLYYRHTLALVETPTEMFLIYAGRNSFYRFDLTNQQPMIMPHFESCSDIFYKQATLDNTERIFAFENGITHEINFVFPVLYPSGTPPDDTMLCYDYKQDTISTSGVVVTAGATIRKPITGLAAGAEKDWCVLGNGQGTVMIYGRVNDPENMPDWNGKKAIWFRREANPYSATKGGYPSVLVSGLGNFGNDFGEKDIRAIVILLDNKIMASPLTVVLYGAQNGNGPILTLGTKVFNNIIVRNLMPVSFRQFYFQSEIDMNGVDNPCALVGLLWSVAPVDSRSIPRA